MAAASKPAQTRWPWSQPLLELHEVSALKAMAAQHPVGFALVIDRICEFDRLSFSAGGDDGRRASDFAEGKRFVASCLRGAVAAKLPSSSRGAPPDLPNSPTPAPAGKS